MSRRVAADKRKGGEFEGYETPSWCVDRLLDWLELPLRSYTPKQRVMIEPACGKGAIISAISKRLRVDEWCAIDVVKDAIDIDTLRFPETNISFQQADFTALTNETLVDLRSKDADLLITNPPYSKAEAFIRTALSNRLAWINAFLLRLNFLEGSKRISFFDEYPLSRVLVLPNRPSFSGDGRTDGTAYAWFVWEPISGSRHATISILKNTPKTERLNHANPTANE